MIAPPAATTDASHAPSTATSPVASLATSLGGSIETLAQLRPALAALPVVLFAFDRTGTCTLSEGGLLSAWGFEPGANVGRDIGEFQERFPEVVEPVSRCLAGESLVSQLGVDGRGTQFELHWAPTYDDHGEVTGLIAMSAAACSPGDLNAAQQVREEYRSLLAAFPDHVLRLSDHGLVTIKPPRRGSVTLPHPCFVSRPIDELLPPDAATKLEHASAAAMRDGRERVIEYGPQDANATTRFEARILREDEGQALVIVREITARYRLENELHEATKLEALGRLAAGVAHEINTPVQFVSHNVEFMGRAFDSMHQLLVAYREALSPGDDPLPWQERAARLAAEEQRHDVDFLLSEVPPAVAEALDGTRRVSTIVQAMRVFSHPSARELSPVDLNDAVRNAVVVSRAQHKQVATVEMDLDDALPPVRCVSGEIAQVLLNLIVNAAQAIEEDRQPDDAPGLITLTTRRDGEHVVITISDDGPGIPLEDQPRVFDPFFTTKPVGAGTGQGLTLVRSLVVAKHGGGLRVTSTPGQGASFEVRLPIDGPPTGSSAADQPSEVRPGSTSVTE